MLLPFPAWLNDVSGLANQSVCKTIASGTRVWMDLMSQSPLVFGLRVVGVAPN